MAVTGFDTARCVELLSTVSIRKTGRDEFNNMKLG